MRIAVFFFFILFSFSSFSQEGLLTFGMQYKPIFASQFFGAGSEQGEIDNFESIRDPKWGHSFGMQIRRGITKSISYETGINYIRRNYWVICTDHSNGFTETFDFGLVGYEIPNQVLFYIRLGEKFYMNTATGISLNWFASDVASNSQTVKFYQKTFLHPGWIKPALIANMGFEYRTEKKGCFYLGASLTNPFSDIANTRITYDENISTADKEVSIGLRGGIFTVDLRYFFHSDPIKKKANEKKQ